MSAGCEPVSSCRKGELVTVTGRLKSVVYTPRETVPTLEAELFDGSGSVTLVWLGPAAHPGHRARPHGHRPRPVRRRRGQAGHLQPLVRAGRRLIAADRERTGRSAPGDEGRGGAGEHDGRRRPPASGGSASAFAFDRHLVLEQLGGWRGMVDATLPTVASSWPTRSTACGPASGPPSAAALLVFLLRLVRRESVQQAVSGLFAVGVAVAIAAASGQARDFFAFGIVRNAVDRGRAARVHRPLRRPLVGVIAEFLAPSHLGAHVLAVAPRDCAAGSDRARDVLAAETAPGDPVDRVRGSPIPSPSGPGGRTAG